MVVDKFLNVKYIHDIGNYFSKEFDYITERILNLDNGLYIRQCSSGLRFFIKTNIGKENYIGSKNIEHFDNVGSKIVQFLDECKICKSCELIYYINNYDFYIKDMCTICSNMLIKTARNDTCYICLEDFKDRAPINFPCSHYMHYKCFYKSPKIIEDCDGCNGDITIFKCGMCRRKYKFNFDGECECYNDNEERFFNNY